jgi:poly(ribitol-phosphate) beta-N-acetylglucosaminyltransferase
MAILGIGTLWTWWSVAREPVPVPEAGVNVDPIVSVVIPVWNVEPYLRECLDSVIGQSLGLERLEVLAVDDGSSDGSGAVLDEYAARYPQVRVFHEPNSGGPGRPRNVGLDHAIGTYVFFLDADDYLGREALARMVDMAEKNQSDVVLGKMVGVGGRLVPSSAFRRTRDRAKLSQVYWTLSVLKMFRRSLIESVGARFPEGLASNEDGIFTQRMYLSATVISVVADYDCYYTRLRPGSQTRGGGGRKDVSRYLSIMTERIELLASALPAGKKRDRLMAKHISAVLDGMGGRWLALPPEDRKRLFDQAAELVTRWHTDVIQNELAPPLRLRAYCLQHGLLSELEAVVNCRPRTAYDNPIIEGPRVFAGYPHFRDDSGIPDACFELTDRIRLRQRIHRLDVGGSNLRVSGEAFLRYVGGTTTIILSRRPSGPEYRFTPEPLPTPHLQDRNTTYRQAGFSAVIDLSTAADGRPLPPGIWDIGISVSRDAFSRRAPLQPPGVDGKQRTRADTQLALRVYRKGMATLQIGPPPPPPSSRFMRVSRAAVRRLRRRVHHRLRVSGRRASGAARERSEPPAAA